MAEAVLVSASTGAMTSVLKKLATMLGHEYKLLKHVRHDIKFLRSELEAMHAFLLRMADVEAPDGQAKLRAKAVRELSYDIEDNIDNFMLLVEPADPGSKANSFKELISKCMNMLTTIKARHRIAKEVKGIKIQVKEVGNRYARYKIDESSSSRPKNPRVDPRVLAAFKDASELVGVDGPRDELATWLGGEGEFAHELKVISIVGCGGSGKTTLANQVYQKLGANFECRASVSISRNPDMTSVLSSILSQISNQEHSHAGAGDQQLINKIREFLRDKRYFIMIDDIWDVPTWRILDCALFKNKCGSRIMSTTRINDVAQSCCSDRTGLVYEIKSLNADDSKKLLFKRIFGCQGSCPSDLIEASDGILKKCGGLPLSINAISSLLATRKQTKEEWDRVRCSIGFSQAKNPDIDAMIYILSLSYFDLPHYLRSCLLYLTLFPEDYEIGRQQLIYRWVSEGFIHGEDTQDLMELGEAYFHELVNRSLIQPVDIEYDGKAWGCRVHDTIRDFLMHKSTEENFCTLVSNQHYSKLTNVLDGRHRRLSLLANEGNVGTSAELNAPHVRSLGVFGPAKQLPSLLNFSALRVLDLGDCNGLENHHVKDIGKLLQLRYLKISWANITELPRQIGDLQYLETLQAECTNLLELPGTLTRLKRLARLFVSDKTKLSDGIGDMKNLQQLEDIGVFKQSVHFLQELGKLSNLRRLRITWNTCGIESNMLLSYKEKLVSSLSMLDTCNLRFLRIDFHLTENDLLVEEDLFFPSLNSMREISIRATETCSRITKWLGSLANLEKLDIYVKEMEQEDILMIGGVPNLLEFNLYLTGTNSTRKPIVIGKTIFQRLEKFEFSFDRKKLMFEAGAMPKLKNLELRIRLGKLKSVVGGSNLGIQLLHGLDRVHVAIECYGMRAADVEAVETAFKIMVEAHPNHPRLEIQRLLASYMLPR